MKYICALIVVDDIIKSRYLFETILKEKVINDFGENVSFESGFAIHQTEHFKKLIDDKKITKRSNNFELYFEDDNLEEMEKIIIENNLELVHKIREQPWKQRVLRFYDYDQNILEIGERMEHVAYRLYLEHMSIDEISKITYLSNDLIKKSIEQYEAISIH